MCVCVHSTRSRGSRPLLFLFYTNYTAVQSNLFALRQEHGSVKLSVSHVSACSAHRSLPPFRMHLGQFLSKTLRLLVRSLANLSNAPSRIAPWLDYDSASNERFSNGSFDCNLSDILTAANAFECHLKFGLLRLAFGGSLPLCVRMLALFLLGSSPTLKYGVRHKLYIRRRKLKNWTH